MQKIWHRVLLITCSILVSVYVCIFISVHYFFDTFYYYKSKAFGYHIPNTHKSLQSFGRRAEDMILLFDKIQNTGPLSLWCPSPNTQLRTDDGVLRIAVIGDSYIWGTGLTNAQIASVKLEKMLQQKMKAKVYIFGNSGDTILDNYIKYRYLQQYYPEIDLFIFGMVENDLHFRKYNAYNQEFFDSFIKLCFGPIYYLQTINSFAKEVVPYDTEVKNSFSSTYANTCVLDLVASLLPKDALFLNHNDHYANNPFREELARYVSSLEAHGLQVISMKGKLTKEAMRYPLVSKKELHPSASMNTAYARVLYEEIERKFNLN